MVEVKVDSVAKRSTWKQISLKVQEAHTLFKEVEATQPKLTPPGVSKDSKKAFHSCRRAHALEKSNSGPNAQTCKDLCKTNVYAPVQK